MKEIAPYTMFFFQIDNFTRVHVDFGQRLRKAVVSIFISFFEFFYLQ